MLLECPGPQYVTRARASITYRLSSLLPLRLYGIGARECGTLVCPSFPSPGHREGDPRAVDIVNAVRVAVESGRVGFRLYVWPLWLPMCSVIVLVLNTRSPAVLPCMLSVLRSFNPGRRHLLHEKYCQCAGIRGVLGFAQPHPSATTSYSSIVASNPLQRLTPLHWPTLCATHSRPSPWRRPGAP